MSVRPDTSAGAWRGRRRAAPAAAALVLCLLPTVAAGQDLVLVRANIVDVEAGRVIPNASIVVSGGRIDAVVPAGGALPAGAQRIDLRGRYVVPGLMDAHVHVASLEQARRALASGVTTARSMGASHYADVGLRGLALAGHAEIPEILAAGYHVRPSPAEPFFLDHPELGGHATSGIRTPDAARSMVRAMLSRGVQVVKTNATERAGLPETDPRRQLYDVETLRAMVEEAGSHGIGVAAHAHGEEGAHAAVLAGVRSIEHGTYLADSTLRLMASQGTFLVPTIAIVADLTMPGGDYDNALLRIRGRHMLPRVREMIARARAAGVRIVAATDTGYGPESTVRIGHELEMYVEIGMTPVEALRTATTVAAELFGVADRTGRIAPGYEADLIVLERNPLEDIRAVQDVLMVINNGRVATRRVDEVS
jgi:imidazolonepropionase-like amidohydrolase